ncbi:protein disulfide-isomerase [Podospora fimiseda]|uniref:protein disulfide-isomerase n=1 Tax=Podospora fimiseda TaxID=252190 RepID=A0AAN7BDI7_9PEZI|nr:protein disulfide-isomerase [Podospora fimiseda]
MKNTSFLLVMTACLAAGVSAWNHISKAAFREGLDSMAYQLIASEKTDNNIVSFDCSLPSHQAFCKSLDVTSFPSIRLYHRDGRLDRYRGPRKAREIALFLRRAIRPAMFDAPSPELVEHFTLLDDVVIMLHPHPDDWQLEDRFVALANKYRHQYTFVMATPFSKTESAVVCYNNLDDVRHRAEDIESVHGLEDFVKLCAEPLIPELTRRNEERYTSTGKSILHYFASTEKEKENYRTIARPLAKKYAEFLHFTTTDVNEYSELLPSFGLDADSKRGLALQNPNTGDVYPLRKNKNISEDIIETFLEDVTSGRLEPWNKQQSGKGGRGESVNNGHDEL